MPVQSMARETGCLRPRLLETPHNSTVDSCSIYRSSYTAEVQKLSHTQVQAALWTAWSRHNLTANYDCDNCTKSIKETGKSQRILFSFHISCINYSIILSIACTIPLQKVVNKYN